MLIWEDHWQVQWFLGNHCKFQWFWSNHCKFSMVFEETITIECFLAVWPLPPMVFQWFLILLPSLSMVFDGSRPLVKRCDGFDGSLCSNIRYRSPNLVRYLVTKFCDIIIIIFGHDQIWWQICHQILWIIGSPNLQSDHFPKVDGKRVVATEVLQNISRWETPFESDFPLTQLLSISWT